MGRKRTSSVHRESEVNVNESKSSSSRTVVTEETVSRISKRRDSSPIYVYEPDEWELSPKTDYTYSRTATYSRLHLDDTYVHPNMARRQLRGDFSRPCGDLLSSSSYVAHSSYKQTGRNVQQRTVAGYDATDARPEEFIMMKRKQTSYDAGDSLSTAVTTHEVHRQAISDKSLEYAGKSILHKEKQQIPHIYGLDRDDVEDEVTQQQHYQSSSYNNSNNSSSSMSDTSFLVFITLLFTRVCSFSTRTLSSTASLLVTGSDRFISGVWRIIRRCIYVVTGWMLLADGTVVSSTRSERSDYRWWNYFILLFLLVFLLIGAYYFFWCPAALSPADNVVTDNQKKPLVVGVGDKATVSPAATGADKAACGCLEQVSTVEKLEQFIDSRVGLVVAQQMNELQRLRTDLQGWTQRLLDAELRTHSEKVSIEMSSDRDVNAEKYNDLLKQQLEYRTTLDGVRPQFDNLLSRSSELREQIVSLSKKLDSLDDRWSASGLAITEIQNEARRLRDDVEVMQRDFFALSEKTGSCYQSNSQMTLFARAAVRDYLSQMVAVDGITEGSGSDENQSRQALMTWLGSSFVDKTELESKLTTVSQRLSEDLNARIQEAALLAAGAAARAAAEHSASSQQVNVESDRQPQEGGAMFIGTVITSEQIRKLILEELAIYDADKTGIVDFALESAGGSVISTRCSETYQPRTAQLSIFGVPLWYTANSPRVVIQPGINPGECWAFTGTNGQIVVQLSHPVVITSVSIEHIPVRLSPTGNIDSAPKNFTVWGLSAEMDTNGVLLGNFTYEKKDDMPLQMFPVVAQQDVVYQYVELKIHTNHGNPLYTCLYRFRVHGQLHTL